MLEGPGTIPGGEIVILVKELAPGVRLREALGMADGWKAISRNLFGILDDEHSRDLWTHLTGE